MKPFELTTACPSAAAMAVTTTAVTDTDERVRRELGEQHAVAGGVGQEALGDRALAVLACCRDRAEHGEEEDRRVADREDRLAQLLRRPEVLLAGVAEGEAGGQQRDGQQRERRPGGAAQRAELEQLGIGRGRS